MTVGSVITDTNILLYAEDQSEPAKRQKAWTTLTALAESRLGVLPTQVLGEYFSVITRKQRIGLDPVTAAHRVAEYRRDFTVLDTTPDIVEEAARGVCAYRLSYYDAQIWASARLAGIGVILSEDFENGREIEGVRFLDPFAADFDLKAVLSTSGGPAAQESVR